jgi:hypothetical protein
MAICEHFHVYEMIVSTDDNFTIITAYCHARE